MTTAPRAYWATRRAPRQLARDRSGSTAVEFALVAPVLLLLAVGMMQFGLALNDYIKLTEAVQAGTRQLALARGSSTPRTSTVSQVNSSAGNLTQANITITTKINGTTCTTDTACKTALSSASGQAATVTATYPCSLQVMGINFMPSCTLSSSTTEMIL